MCVCGFVSVCECVCACVQSSKSRACHAKKKHRGAETKGRQRDARGVHHAPCRAASPAPATPNRSTEARRPRDARGTPEAYITPLAEQQVPRLPREIEAQRRGDQGTPEGRQRRTSRLCRAADRAPAARDKSTETRSARRDARGVHHAPCRAANPAPATPNRSTEARRPRDARGMPEAYITPLAHQQIARLPHEIEAQRRGAQEGRLEA